MSAVLPLMDSQHTLTRILCRPPPRVGLTRSSVLRRVLQEPEDHHRGGSPPLPPNVSITALQMFLCWFCSICAAENTPPHTAALLLHNRAHSGFYYRCLVFGAASAFCPLVKNEQLMLTGLLI